MSRNRLTLSVACVGALIVLTCGDLSAPRAEDYSRPAPIASPPVAIDHASTVAEGFLRGEADTVRAAGEFNYNTAAAAVMVQEARSRFYENEVSKTEAYFQKRRLNEAYRAAKRSPRPDKTLMARVSQIRTPKRLEAAQLNGPLGAIDWSAALEAPEFADCRKQLDRLFAERAPSDSGLKSENYRQIQKAAREMGKLLSSKFRQMEQMEFLVARKFLDSLAYEARFKVEEDRVASN